MLLLLWTLLGAGLRLAGLDVKPPWLEEFNTVVLSLGNSLTSVPLDRVISVQDLLAPLIPNPEATVTTAIRQAIGADRQPPLYFALTQLWMQLFPTADGLASMWAARALAATIGIVTIPLTYVCSYLVLRSRSIANFSAAMLAVSPYGVYIAQEARHYSLATLWLTISLTCLIAAGGRLARRQKLPLRIVAGWIVVNILAMATNYLVGIALIAEVLVLGGFWLWQMRQAKRSAKGQRVASGWAILSRPSWRRVELAIVGTAVGVALGWWLLSTYPTVTTAWLDNSPYKSIELVNPIFQLIGAAITIMSLLLVEVSELPPVHLFSGLPLDLNLPTIVVSALLMLGYFGWVLPMLKRALRLQLRSPIGIETLTVGSFVVLTMGLYLFVTWLTGVDITRGARYQFGYFPGTIVALGLGLASCWQQRPSLAKWVRGKQAVAIVLVMGLVSSLIVTTNYGYHKYYRPDLLVPLMASSAPLPVLIATTHHHPDRVGEMMGLAWELRRTDKIKSTPKTSFLLAQQFQKYCERDCPPTKILQETIERISAPLDLWAVNFYAPIVLPPTCAIDKKFTAGIYGYEYRLYHCQPLKDTD